MKILLAILFLISSLPISIFADINEDKQANILILDKTSSTKYNINIINDKKFRSINFKIIKCLNYEFEKYTDKILLLEINNKNKIFTGWFFMKTPELNKYSDKIYEINLIDCVI